MLKIKVTEKSGASIEYTGESEIIGRLPQLGHGKPERWQLHKDEPMAEAYDDANVLEEKVEQVNGVDVKKVKLKAEYTVSIEDITEQHNLQQVIAKRKAEYPSAEEFMNAFFDGGDEALAALQAKRLEIKAKYPKI